MRAFIGVDFNRQLKDDISHIQSSFRKLARKGRWKHTDNLHLTLKFLGEIDNNAIPGIKMRLSSICSQLENFRLKIETAGYFAGRDCLRVLWLGLGEDNVRLLNTQKKIEDALIPEGFTAEERKYSPHITIAQDVVLGMDFDKACAEAVKISDNFIDVDSICLFKSEQISDKRVYTVIERFRLGQKE